MRQTEGIITKFKKIAPLSIGIGIVAIIRMYLSNDYSSLLSSVVGIAFGTAFVVFYRLL